MISNLFRFPYRMIRPVYERTSFHRSVIDEVEDPELRDSFKTCREITRHYAKTFYLATRFLPNHKQRGIFAIYALCRYLDDLVDETVDLVSSEKVSAAEIIDLMDVQKRKLQAVYDGGRGDGHPVFTAFAQTLRSFYIPVEHPFALIDGVCMDLTKKRYETFDEVRDYSYKVASVVGLMTSEVFGYSDRQALDYAVDLGIAMQLTNILRDVGEDMRRGRIYLPAEDLRRFGVTEEDLQRQVVDSKFIALMEFQICRAEYYYRRSDPGIELLSRDACLPVLLARHNYCRILEQIRANGYNVFDRRACLTTGSKLAILPRLLLKKKQVFATTR